VYKQIHTLIPHGNCRKCSVRSCNSVSRLRGNNTELYAEGMNNASPEAVLNFGYPWLLISVYAENISGFRTKRLIFAGSRTELIQKPVQYLQNRHWGGFSSNVKVQSVFRNVTACLPTVLCLVKERTSCLGSGER